MTQIAVMMRIAYALECIAASLAKAGGVTEDEKTSFGGSAPHGGYGEIVQPNSCGGGYCEACGCGLITGGDIESGECPACGSYLKDPNEGHEVESNHE